MALEDGGKASVTHASKNGFSKISAKGILPLGKQM